MPSEVIKDPDSVLDYVFDWAPLTNARDGAVSDWLAAGETITSGYTVTVDSGLTKDSDARSDSNTSVTVWLSGGTAGTDYEVVCHIVTSSAREDDRTLTVKCRER